MQMRRYSKGRAAIRMSLCLLLWHAAIAGSARADWYASKTGSNTAPHNSPATAAHDIQEALNEAAPYGGFVWVAEGEYVGNIVVPEGVYLVGEGPGKSVIAGVATADSSEAVVALGHDSHLYGFSVNANGAGVGVRSRDGLSHISRCEVSGANWVGISAARSWVQVSGCSILRNGGAGIFSSSSALTMTDSLVCKNQSGIQCDGYELVMAHCTVVHNFWTGVNNLNAAFYTRDSIIYGNGEDLREVPAWSLVNCVVGDADVTGVNGNISTDPLFVSWGEFNDTNKPVFVDASHTGPEEGARTSPFRSIRAALDAYDYRLAVGSPCVGAASDGRNIGAFPDETPVREPGSRSVLVNVAPGLYREGELSLLSGDYLRGPGPRLATISPPGFCRALTLWGNSTVDGFSIVVTRSSAIQCDPRGEPMIANCLISGSDGLGAGVSGGSPRVLNCVIWGMRHPASGSPSMTNCTIAANLWERSVFPPYSSPIITNSIIWGNLPENVRHSLVSDPSVAGTNENIVADPRFVDPENGDFRLLSDSPCIDAGLNDRDLPETDIAGMHRIMFGGRGLTVDMGAYEYYINELQMGPGPNQTILTWSSLADKTYSIFYADDLFTWHLADEDVLSAGNMTTSWTDDGSKTGVAPSLAPRRFYRIVENP